MLNINMQLSMTSIVACPIFLLEYKTRPHLQISEKGELKAASHAAKIKSNWPKAIPEIVVVWNCTLSPKGYTGILEVPYRFNFLSGCL